MTELDQTKRRLAWTVYATALVTFITNLGLSIGVSMFELQETVTSDWTSTGQPLLPWNTHYQFSINALLSKLAN